MGTRNLTCVVLDGKYRVAQYGQWDGYFEGQGKLICEFIVAQLQTPEGLAQFKERVASAVEISEDELRRRWESVGAVLDEKGHGLIGMDIVKDFQAKWPWLDRDCGGKILQHVMDHTGLEVQLGVEFAGDGLSCEFAYVVNLDNDTLEIYVGHNEEPLQPGERFYGFVEQCPGYYPIKHYRTFPLSEITLDTMANLAAERNKMYADNNAASSDDDSTPPDAAKSTLVVYKYAIDLAVTEHLIEMPEGAQILHVHSGMLWALVDTSKPTVKRRVVSIATGTPMVDHPPLGGRVYHLFAID